MLDSDRPATTRSSATPVVGITGDIDLRSVTAFRLNVAKAQADSDDLVIDLRHARFVGNAGVDVLVEAARRASLTGGRLTVLTLTPAMRRAIVESGLDAMLERGVPD